MEAYDNSRVSRGEHRDPELTGPEAPETNEPASSPRSNKNPEKPLSRAERREHERLQRQEERRLRQSWASAYNGPPPGTGTTATAPLVG
jgi:hypothetical protein